MNVRLDATDPELSGLLHRVAREAATAAIASQPQPTVWLSVPRAAEYLDTTEDSIRALVKRRQVPCHRTQTGRVLFRVDELDAWASGGAAANSTPIAG